MRAILQRVKESSVIVDGETVGAIGAGLMVLVAAEAGDGESEVVTLADKLAVLRIFADQAGHLNRDASQVGAEFMIVSQFTLAASLRKGRRPSFNGAAAPALAEPLVSSLVGCLRNKGFRVAEGRFGAHMEVHLINDGPVTFVLDVKEGRVL